MTLTLVEVRGVSVRFCGGASGAVCVCVCVCVGVMLQHNQGHNTYWVSNVNFCHNYSNRNE